MEGTRCKLENRNALITGGSRGIGKAIARRFVEEGANVFLCARGEGALEETAKELRQMGGKVGARAADVSESTVGGPDGEPAPGRAGLS